MSEFKQFLKQNQMTAIQFAELVKKPSSDYRARISKQGPDILERLAMAAIAAGLPPWKAENAELYAGVNNMVQFIYKQRVDGDGT